MKKKTNYSEINPLDEGWINLTPLIDVLFVILIAFILIAPLVDVEKVDLAPSSFKKTRDMPKDEAIAIYVHFDNSIWIDKKRVNGQELLSILRKKHSYFPTKVPRVFHDRNATFGTYQKVKDTLEEAGFKEMEVVLQGR